MNQALPELSKISIYSEYVPESIMLTSSVLPRVPSVLTLIFIISPSSTDIEVVRGTIFDRELAVDIVMSEIVFAT